MNIPKSSLVFSFFSFLGKVLGYVRDGSIAFFFGGSVLTDIFYVAFKVMGSTAVVIGELTITPTFVSIYSKFKENEFDLKSDFTKLVFISFLGLTLIFTISVLCFPYSFIAIFAPGYIGSDNIDFIANVFRVMSLYPITILIVSMMYAHLYVKERFALGPASPIIFNLSIVIGLFCLYYINHLSIIYLAWSVVIAGILQVLFLALNFKYKNKVKFFFKYSSSKKEYLLFLKTLWPAVLNVGFNQIDKLIGIAFASFTVGYVTYIYIAERIYSLPIELVGIPLATVLLTAVSSAKIENEVRKIVFLKSISFLIYLIIPASFGLFIISEELLSLFFERGKFTKESVILTNDLLRGFLIGLPAFTLVTTLNPYFFAIKKTKILFYCSFISSITNVILLFSLYNKFGPLSIAISLSISKYINLFLLLYQLKKIEINILSKNQIYNIITSLLFSIIMILVMTLISKLIQGFGSGVIQTLILVISGLLSYLILTILLNNKFYNQMYNFLLNKRS